MSEEEIVSDFSLSDEEYVPPVDEDSESTSESSLNDDDDDTLAVTSAGAANNERLSKSGIYWSNNPSSSNIQRGRNTIRPVNSSLPRTSTLSPKEVFCLFFSEEIVNEILLQTNSEGRRVSTEFHKTWKPVTKEELQAYFGILLLAGSQKSNDVPIRELFLDSHSDPYYKAAFSVNRFESIHRFLRFDDKRTREVRLLSDKLSPIRFIWDKFIMNCTSLYEPGENLTIDEQLVPYRGRCSFIQYMPSKPAKYGIKFFWLTDSESFYAMNGSIYSGKPPGMPTERNLATNIVQHLSRPIYYTGRNLTMDNYFTDVQLAEHLLEKRVTLVGTLRSNKRDIPPIMKHSQERPLYDSVFGFHNKITMLSYKAKRNKSVILISSMHHNKNVMEGRKKKPEIILYYNSTKGGVDTMDEMIQQYTCKRSTKRWPMVIFMNMLDIAALNAYLLLIKANPAYFQGRKDSRRLFLKELCKELIMPNIKIRVESTTNLPHDTIDAIKRCGATSIPSTSDRVPSTSGQMIKKRKRCFLCSVKKERKTERCCCVCKRNVCKEHSEEIIRCDKCK